MKKIGLRKAIGLFFLLLFFSTGTFVWGQTTPKDQTAFQLQSFRPWGDPHGLFHMQSAKTLQQWNYTVGLMFNYSKDPLTLRASDGSMLSAGKVLSDQVGADLTFGIGFLNWFDLYVSIPVTLYQLGSVPNSTIFGNQANQNITGTFLQDIKVAVKFGLLRQEKHAINLSLQGYVGAPTAVMGNSKAFNGEDSFSAGGELLLSRSFGEWWDLLLNVGYRYMPLTEYTFPANPSGTLALEHELNYGLGAAIHVHKHVSIATEFNGKMSLNNVFLDSTSLDFLFGLKIFPLSTSKSLIIHLGFGLPIYSGLGSPLFRVFAGLIWSPQPRFTEKDTDGDGIPDSSDQCPTVKGPKENQGCPWGDKDEDGIPDNIDKCPYVKGPKENQGCPYGDTDKDGLTDNIDKCPFVKGPKENQGCPWGDKDGDGVMDNEDKCPDVKGPKENAGCPYGDKDKDGVPDNEDKCPDVYGPVENRGCPWGDKDKDGVLDNVDECPDVPGSKSNRGCPKKMLVKVTKSNIEILQRIYFDTSKAKIKTVSFEVLNQVVSVLTSNPKVKLEIQGHTDDVGKKEFNKELSSRRASAVKAFLVQKGIDASRLVSIGFGMDKPLVANKNSKARAKNRRVEFKITHQ